MHSSRESVLIVLLLISLGVAVVYGVLQRAEASAGWRGSVQSNRPDGARSLYVWLSNLGYNVRTLDQAPLSLSSSDKVLFVLATNEAFTAAELQDLDQWIESGGTLIVARDTAQPGQLLDHYRTPLAQMRSSVERAPLRLPTLNWPPVGEVRVHASHKLRLQREVAVVHIGDRSTPLLVAFGQGKGKVFVMSTVYPFTNDGLWDANNAQLVHNLVRTGTSQGGGIAFDQAHRKEQPTVISLAWLVSTAEGWGMIYTAVVFLAYLMLRFRRLGAPIVPPTDWLTPRATDEYITAVVGMHGQMGMEKTARRHYWDRLKRNLARQYRLDPALHDDDFLKEVARYKDELDLRALVYLLIDMRREDGGKMDLLHWVERILAWQQNWNVHTPVED
jgi:hypothetical protein